VLNELRDLIDEGSPDKINKAILTLPGLSHIDREIIRLAFLTPGEGMGGRSDADGIERPETEALSPNAIQLAQSLFNSLAVRSQLPGKTSVDDYLDTVSKTDGKDFDFATVARINSIKKYLSGLVNLNTATRQLWHEMGGARESRPCAQLLVTLKVGYAYGLRGKQLQKLFNDISAEDLYNRMKAIQTQLGKALPEVRRALMKTFFVDEKAGSLINDVWIDTDVLNYQRVTIKLAKPQVPDEDYILISVTTSDTGEHSVKHQTYLGGKMLIQTGPSVSVSSQAELMVRLNIYLSFLKDGSPPVIEPYISEWTEKSGAYLEQLIINELRGQSFTREEQFEKVLNILRQHNSRLADNLDFLSDLKDGRAVGEISKKIEKLQLSTLDQAIIRLAFFTPGEGSGKRNNEPTITELHEQLQTVISDVEGLTNEISTHEFLGSQGPIDLSKTVIVMKKGLPDVFGDDKETIIRNALKQGYQHMTQELRKLFRNGEGVVEVKNETEMPDIVDSLIKQGLKVIVLGDTDLAIAAEDTWKRTVRGKSGEDYCVITAGMHQDLSPRTIHYINLNAMALIGAGMLNHDEILFTTAYELFAGEEPGQGIMLLFRKKTLRSLNIFPRVIKLIGTIADREMLRKLFAVSA